MKKVQAYKHGAVNVPISNPIIFFSENNSPKLWNGLFRHQSQNGVCSCYAFCVSNLRHSPIFSLVQGVQLWMTVTRDEVNTAIKKSRAIYTAF
jgi:hypothetical protein